MNSNTPDLINEPDILVEGFHKVDSHLLEPKAPRLKFMPKFYEKADEQKLEYLVKLASTMNQATVLIQNERDELVKLMVKKEAQLEKMAEMMRQNNEMLQQEVTRMNEQRQQYHQRMMAADERIRELESEVGNLA